MKINDDYQKHRGQQTSFPTEEIMEPKRKYLESNLFYLLSNFSEGIIRKINESE